MEAFEQELPPLASLSRVQIEAVPVTREASFDIRQSRSHEQRTAQISPDTFVCEACLNELFDPSDRRYRYPFINCRITSYNVCYTKLLRLMESTSLVER